MILMATEIDKRPRNIDCRLQSRSPIQAFEDIWALISSDRVAGVVFSLGAQEIYIADLFLSLFHALYSSVIKGEV